MTTLTVPGLDWRRLPAGNELDCIVAMRLGYTIEKYVVTKDDTLWNVYKSMRGPKWYLRPSHDYPGAYVRLHDKKIDCRQDVPAFSTSAEITREIHFEIFRAMGNFMPGPGLTPLSLCQSFCDWYDKTNLMIIARNR